MTFSGFANGPLPCDCRQCEWLNCSANLVWGGDTAGACGWSAPLCSPSQPYRACGAAAIAQAKLAIVDGDYVLTVSITSGGSAYFQFAVNFGSTKPDCAAWSSLNVPYVGAPTLLPEDWGQCDASEATCVLSASTASPVACPTTQGCAASYKTCYNAGLEATCFQGFPSTAVVTIPAGVWAGAGCDAKYAGTFVCDFSESGGCWWYYNFAEGGPYDFTQIVVKIMPTYVDVAIDSFYGGVGWRLATSDATCPPFSSGGVASLPDCTFGGAVLSLPYFSVNPTFLQCDWDGATPITVQFFP